MKKDRWAVFAAFFINGGLLASWVSRIPAVQQRLQLSEGELGIVLLGMAVGVLLALSSAGGLVARHGSYRVIWGGNLVLFISLPLLAVLPTAAALWLGLAVFGGSMSVMDVAMNAQAVEVENTTGRPLMSSFHGSFSVGGLAGALLGSWMAGTGISVLVHFVISSAIFGLIAVFMYRFLLRENGQEQETGSVIQLPPRALWPIGAIAFSSAIGEGAMADWSAVYLQEVLLTSGAVAALGFAAFSLTMTAGRFTGDWLTARFRPPVIVRGGGLISALGLAAAALTDSPVIAIAGFAAVGIGLANIVPLAFSAAGNFPGIPSGAGIAGAATIGYAGFLAGPPVIGLLAEATSLRVSMFFVAALAITMMVTANGMKPAVRQQQAAHGAAN